jgi:hypothetical protein
MSVLGILRADVIGLLAKPLEAKGLLHWNAAVTEVRRFTYIHAHAINIID